MQGKPWLQIGHVVERDSIRSISSLAKKQSFFQALRWLHVCKPSPKNSIHFPSTLPLHWVFFLISSWWILPLGGRPWCWQLMAADVEHSIHFSSMVGLVGLVLDLFDISWIENWSFVVWSRLLPLLAEQGGHCGHKAAFIRRIPHVEDLEQPINKAPAQEYMRVTEKRK